MDFFSLVALSVFALALISSGIYIAVHPVESGRFLTKMWYYEEEDDPDNIDDFDLPLSEAGEAPSKHSPLFYRVTGIAKALAGVVLILLVFWWFW